MKSAADGYSPTIRKIVDMAGGQIAAAGMLGISQASISRILSGDQSPSKPIINLAEMIISKDEPPVK